VAAVTRTGEDHIPDGWAGELAHLFHRLKMTSGVDPATENRRRYARSPAEPGTRPATSAT
jgi:hypothetical protein